jgi:hypothetical protein
MRERNILHLAIYTAVNPFLFGLFLSFAGKSIGLCFCNENGVRHTLDSLFYSFYVRGLFLVEWGLKIAVLANPKLLSASIHDLYFFVTRGFLAFKTFQNVLQSLVIPPSKRATVIQ